MGSFSSFINTNNQERECNGYNGGRMLQINKFDDIIPSWMVYLHFI